uniref:Uncharacterized protein n=1 Tax=Anguilla anguilla TaxID=7936 RepID=A0A0E9X243_ANGAN
MHTVDIYRNGLDVLCGFGGILVVLKTKNTRAEDARILCHVLHHALAGGVRTKLSSFYITLCPVM